MAKKPKVAAKVKGPKKPKIRPDKKPKLVGKRQPPKKPEQIAILKKVKRKTEKPDMSNNALNVTVACPIGMVDEGNQFALTVGYTEADVNTFGEHNRMTIGGNDYYVANLNARATFMYAPHADLTDDAKEKGADLTKANAAQAALVVWGGDGEIPAPAPDAITVIVQPIYPGAGSAAIAMMEAA